MLGKTKLYNQDKGWGFITADDGKDYYFHISDIINDEPIQRGQKIPPGRNCDFDLKEITNRRQERQTVCKNITIDL